MESLPAKRIISIDVLRGVVMVLMALDHVRDYFFLGSFFSDPLNLSTTTAPVFFTRWVTHFCAPVFVFLAGISAFLYVSKRVNRKKASIHLFIRGLFLIFLELTVVNFGWTFDFTASFQILQVLWAIGFSMIFLSAAIFMPRKIILAIGLSITILHNLSDSIVLNGHSLKSVVWYILHQKTSLLTDGGTLISFTYPVLPWIGIIFLGYSMGALYRSDFDCDRRKRILLLTGIASIAVFLLLRGFNFWGESALWSRQHSPVYSLMSFLNTTKYPPSMLFTLMTLGPALIFLSFTENRDNRYTAFFTVFGKVPMFYYIVHLYVIHLLAIGGVLISGRKWSDMILTAQVFRTASLRNYGFDLHVVYLVWIIVIFMVYFLCRKYGKFKCACKGKWWISYL